MNPELFDVVSNTDFIDDWMFHSVSPLRLSNAMLSTFLLNRGHLRYTHKDGSIYHLNRAVDNLHIDMRRDFISMMGRNIEDHRFGLLLISPHRQIGNEVFPKRLSCHALTIYSGSPRRASDQLLDAIDYFVNSSEWEYWIITDTDSTESILSFAAPVRMIVFEIDNYYNSRDPIADPGMMKKRHWLIDVARQLEIHYLANSLYSLRCYYVTNYTTQLIDAELLSSCKPLIRAIFLEPNSDDDSPPDHGGSTSSDDESD